MSGMYNNTSWLYAEHGISPVLFVGLGPSPDQRVACSSQSLENTGSEELLCLHHSIARKRELRYKWESTCWVSNLILWPRRTIWTVELAAQVISPTRHQCRRQNSESNSPNSPSNVRYIHSSIWVAGLEITAYGTYRKYYYFSCHPTMRSMIFNMDHS